MDSDERRNKIIVGVVIIVVTVAIVALILVKTSSSALTCQLTDVDPSQQKDKKTDLKNIASADNKALAFFGGHLKYELADKKDKKVFLPVELQSIQQIDADKTGVQRLVLNLNCAQVNISLVTEKDVVQATSVEVHLTSANGKVDSCAVNKAGLDLISFAAKNHFLCESFELTCEHDDKPAPTTPAPTTPKPTTPKPTTPKPTTEKPTTEKPTTKNPAEMLDVDLDESEDVYADEALAPSATSTLVTLAIQKLEFELNGNADKHKKLEFDTEAVKCKKAA